MLKASIRNPALRRRARQFGRLVRRSVVTPRTGEIHRPALVTNGELGLTFIGHASYFVQIGGLNVRIDPNFPRRPRVPKRLRQPGIYVRDRPASGPALV